MTEREKFAKEYSLHAGISVESIKFDDYGTPYIDTPYVTTVIPNVMVKAAYWGWKAHKAQAVPKANKDLLQSLRDMVEIVGANFCSNQAVKHKYKIARELLEQNK